MKSVMRYVSQLSKTLWDGQQLAQLRAEALAVPAADMPQPAAAAGGQREIFLDRHARRAAAHRILKQTADDL